VKLLKLSEKNDVNYEGKKADNQDYDTLLDEDTEVRKPDGSLLCVVLKKSITAKNTARAWAVLRDEHMWTNNRGTATGEGITKRNKQVISAEPVDSGIMGFFERTARFPYCRACAWNLNNPEKWTELLPMIKEVDGLLKKYAKERYLQQAKIADRTHKDFLIPGTRFSTLTVNKNFRTAYHRDAGNLPDGISCMTVIRQGKWSGANLVFPQYRVAAKLDTFDTIIFDPHELHGNTSLIKLSEDAVRCSIVYYFRDKIQQCGSAQEELDRVKNRKQGEQLFKTITRKAKK
jgi:hypothetical protein